MSNIHMGCTALAGTNKVGLLKPNANGYYEMVLGAIGVENSAGDFYEAGQDVKSLFGPGSALHRRITTGQCRAELGHPKKTPGMTDRDYVNRILTIEEKNISAHIASVRLDDNVIRDHKGNKVLATIGLVKPCGPYGSALEQSLKNPEENVAFSIRSLTANKFQGGRMLKTIRTVVNWDQVNEPGISVATKFNAPSLESFEEDVILLPEYLDLIDESDSTVASLETSGIDTTMIRTDLGWAKVQHLDLASDSW